MKRFIAIALVMLLAFSLTGCDRSEYKKAQKLYENGAYAEAVDIFASLGDYEDSETMVSACKYGMAADFYGEENYTSAAELFLELDDYKDSAEMYIGCNQKLLDKYLEEENYTEALAAAEILSEAGVLDADSNMIGWCKVAEYLHENGPYSYKDFYTVTIDLGEDPGELDIAAEMTSTGTGWGISLQFNLMIQRDSETALLGAGQAMVINTAVGAGNTKEVAAAEIVPADYHAGDEIDWQESSSEGTTIYGEKTNPNVGFSGSMVEKALSNMDAALKNMGIGVSLKELGFINY